MLEIAEWSACAPTSRQIEFAGLLQRFLLLCVLGALTGLAGCGGDSYIVPSAPGSGTVASGTGVALGGLVQGAGRPMAGSSVQLYAAGSAGNAAGATALLPVPVAAGADGTFTIAGGSYTCPGTGSQLYLLARGGTPTPSSGASLGTFAALAALGPCGELRSGAQATLNEATTVASAWGFAQFLSPDGVLGSSATNTVGLANAVLTAQALASVVSGQTPGVGYAATTTAPTRKLNTIANLLALCASAVSSAGCSALEHAVLLPNGDAPADTLAAAVALARAPATSVAVLYQLARNAAAIYTPALAAQPADWTMVATHTGGGLVAPVNGGANGPTALAVDASGRVWIASHAGVVSALSPLGVPVFANGLTGGGLNEVYGLAIDPDGNIWATNTDSLGGVNAGQGSVTKFSGTGAVLSGANGFGSGGLNKPYGVAIDLNGTVWITDNGNAHVTLLNSSGVPQSGASGFGSGPLAFPAGVAIDAAHDGWVGNASGSEVTRVAPDGSSLVGVSCCNGAAALAADATGSVWAANFFGDSISRVAVSGTVAPGGPYTGGGLNRPNGIAIDGAGRPWVSNFAGAGVTEMAGSADTTPGTMLSPAAGWAADAGLAGQFGIAVDASGNVWVANFNAGSVTELIGAAAPVKTPLLGPVRQP